MPLPPRLLAHLSRWLRVGIVKDYFVEWNGKPVQSIKVGFGRAISLTELSGKVTPHTLRHTAATLAYAGWRIGLGSRRFPWNVVSNG